MRRRGRRPKTITGSPRGFQGARCSFATCSSEVTGCPGCSGRALHLFLRQFRLSSCHDSAVLPMSWLRRARPGCRNPRPFLRAYGSRWWRQQRLAGAGCHCHPPRYWRPVCSVMNADVAASCCWEAAPRGRGIACPSARLILACCSQPFPTSAFLWTKPSCWSLRSRVWWRKRSCPLRPSRARRSTCSSTAQQVPVVAMSLQAIGPSRKNELLVSR
mmetsp:Transcript_12979/g.37762  ORF Transcript_12979/g.37762 Transcript_12979/m.37762 type:complete len:216 (-) Transcript_12979:308-955(-)